MDDDEIEVEDDAGHDRFLHVQDGLEAELRYRAGAGRLVLEHTEVPEALGGRGIGGRLVRAAAERAARTGEVLVPHCEYARSWLEKRPDVTSLVEVDWDDVPDP